MIIHTLEFTPENWMQLTNELSQLDRFDAQWQAIERREKNTLKELKSIATVRSVGASTRIEGSNMTDNEVGILIDHLDITNLTERDQQEVAGYYEALNLIGESYREINITESHIKHLHNTLMRYSYKDEYHKGNYKINSNRVESTGANGVKTTIFETAAPGLETEDAMKTLIDWYHNDQSTNALIKAAIFVYEFLSIHPFQDGNGRLSRLLGTLLLMKSGYVWIEYVSFEHEIEHRKKEYYKNLMDAQRNRPGEDVTAWVYFFLDCLKNIQQQLLEKIKQKEQRDSLGIREEAIYAVVENNPGISSGEIAERLRIPNPTVKRILSTMVSGRSLIVHGVGRGTSYSIATTDQVKRDLTIRFSNQEREKEFTLQQPGAFVRIKRIILTPHFDWIHPDEWVKKLSTNGLYLTLKAVTGSSIVITKDFSVFAYVTPMNYQPVLNVEPNMVIPGLLHTAGVKRIDYPIRCCLTLSGSVDVFDFDVMLVIDEG